ncbi:leucine-rich repeat-containing protein 56 isoform X2 [Perognathus longimembris pacificus]|uniref:leucine-rich repeat-containing protein 56 isoform X2 n=1 Tax=Perognathus longimembris pacificus TaxID=214514 RepID=UPI002019B7BC|nr:leucine-rich repeat-containing protein 56 isoform X2 [Perognathus longimembris pacificus]
MWGPRWWVQEPARTVGTKVNKGKQKEGVGPGWGLEPVLGEDFQTRPGSVRVVLGVHWAQIGDRVESRRPYFLPLLAGWMWMDPAWDGSQGPLPGTVNVRVRELSWQGQHNPSPHSKGLGSHGSIHREQLMKEHLSPARLQALAQVDDLQMVRVLEMCVDTRENSLGNFGVHLPNLNQLKLNGSRLTSLRDLGTSLGSLQVLWLARCGLTDLDGIGSLPTLKELYVSYNNISDLSPLCLLEQLEVLDLEGNSVDDLGQVRYLQLCPRLATLTLEGNLVCLRPAPGPSNKASQGYNYRAEVRKLIPQLHTLDEMPATHTHLPDTQTLNQDWLMVKEAIKESSLLDSLLPRLDHSPGATMQKPDSVLPLSETQPWSLSLLVPGGHLPEGLLPEDPVPGDHASNLTHGNCSAPAQGKPYYASTPNQAQTQLLLQVLGKSSVGTPPKACESVDTSARYTLPTPQGEPGRQPSHSEPTLRALPNRRLSPRGPLPSRGHHLAYFPPQRAINQNLSPWSGPPLRSPTSTVGQHPILCLQPFQGQGPQTSPFSPWACVPLSSCQS